jgi:hypothetical protein
MNAPNLRNFTWLLLLSFSAMVTNSCVKQEPILMSSSAKLSDGDIAKMKSKANRGDWHAAYRLYSHYAYYERREDLATPYKWGIDERNRRSAY